MLSVKLKSRFEREKTKWTDVADRLLEVSHSQAVSGGTFLTIGTVKTGLQCTRGEMQPSREKFSSS